MQALALGTAFGDHGQMIRIAALLALPLLLLSACDGAGSGTAATATPAVRTDPPANTDPQATRGAVVIASVEDVEPGGEPVDVALQTEAQWNTQDAIYRARVPADAAHVALRFEEVRPGRYAAIAVQPNAPDLRRTRDGEVTDTALPQVPPLPSLRADSSGGRVISNSEAGGADDFGTAAFDIAEDGATVPLTLERR